MRTLPKLLIAIAVAAAAAPFLFDRGVDAGATPAPAPAPATVDVSPVRTATFAPRHWAPGSVISRRDAQVAGESGGRVVRVAEIGQALRAGDALAVLDDTGLRLREQEAAAEAGRIRAQLDLATRQEARYARLAARQDIARAQHDQLQADRDVLAQELARARALLAQISHQRERMVVRAPFPGTVAERHAQAGEYLAAGATVARLVDTADLEVRVRAPVELARHLAVGTPVTVRSADGDREHPVGAVVPIGDENSRQLELRIVLDAPRFPVGSAVDVGLPGAAAREVLAVPRDAVILRREGDYVLRVDAAERAERVAVETGSQLDDLVEVSGALAPGDRLIVRGGERVQPGQAVVVQDRADAVARR
ncbi:efflux RND transporter periplasmic adaptor subunit [Luteimonas sp. SJ-92]|uniref:Efflux RND transporter periplasmic adaptor subunit n=1 Tax=Luteimonas salinisoli TaxID=2752307 RepID=A0A853JAC0_9GAMM|nr:efflux RND transporter periplasmic adaptor subunit [Luteimonas salinisoli]NZA25694.1 efflux RND transporter periplasmic adaptor subunit [Luteimonas salinisoli]